MKRFFCGILTLVLLFGLTACANTEKKWQEQYDLGMRYLEDGDYEEAIVAFSAAIKIDGNRPEAYVGRAEAYMATGEMDKALEDYKKAKRIAKKSDEDYDELIEELEEIIGNWEDIIDENRHDGENTDGENTNGENTNGENTNGDNSGVDNIDVDTTPEPAVDVYTLLKTYFYANYSDSDMVYLADVTQDGQDEMLVVHLGDSEGNTIYGHVYAVVDGTVREIYSNSGSSSHAGGFYSWYLTKAAGVGYNLCEESFDMWQGYGTLAYWEYTVNPDGTTRIVYDISVTGDDAPVDDESYNAYVSTLRERLSGCYAIYYTSSEGGGAPLLDTSPASVFTH